MAHNFMPICERLMAKESYGIPARLQGTHQKRRIGDGATTEELQNIGMSKSLPNIDFLLNDL